MSSLAPEGDVAVSCLFVGMMLVLPFSARLIAFGPQLLHFACDNSLSPPRIRPAAAASSPKGHPSLPGISMSRSIRSYIRSHSFISNWIAADMIGTMDHRGRTWEQRIAKRQGEIQLLSQFLDLPVHNSETLSCTDSELRNMPQR